MVGASNAPLEVAATIDAVVATSSGAVLATSSGAVLAIVLFLNFSKDSNGKNFKDPAFHDKQPQTGVLPYI